MRILLPPSEAKHPGGRGAPFGSTASPASPGLSAARDEVIESLLKLLSTQDEVAISRALALPPAAVADSLQRNRTLLHTPTLPAVQRYAGVVYDGLDLASLSSGARRKADRTLLIFSGLFGVLQGRERIPNYRVPAKSSLPGIGVAGTFWRGHLAGEVERLLDNGLIVDLRSSDYAAMWRPRSDGEAADRIVTVRITSPKPGGGTGVISYPSKFYKGRLAARLLEVEASGTPVTQPWQVLDHWTEIGGKRGTVHHGRTGIVLELETFTSTVVTSA